MVRAGDHWAKFLPIRQKEFVNQTIHYHASDKAQLKPALVEFLAQCHFFKVITLKLKQVC